MSTLLQVPGSVAWCAVAGICDEVTLCTESNGVVRGGYLLEEVLEDVVFVNVTVGCNQSVRIDDGLPTPSRHGGS